EHRRDERRNQEIDGAERIGFAHLLLDTAKLSDENDRNVLRLWLCAEPASGPEAGEPGQAHIQQNQRKILLDRESQRLLTGAGTDDLDLELLQNRLQCDQLGRLMVDRKDVDDFF